MKKTEKAETIAEGRVENGQMAPDLKEMKDLGKQMENLRTNEELANDYGKSPDPIQHEEEELDDK